MGAHWCESSNAPWETPSKLFSRPISGNMTEKTFMQIDMGYIVAHIIILDF